MLQKLHQKKIDFHKTPTGEGGSLFYETFLQNRIFLLMASLRPPYRKLKPLKPGFIENSNFENNRDPCQPHRGGQSLFYDRPSCFRKLHSNFSGNLQISRAWIIDEPWIFPGPVYFQVLGNFRGLGQLNPLENSSKLEITRGSPLENFRWR